MAVHAHGLRPVDGRLGALASISVAWLELAERVIRTGELAALVEAGERFGGHGRAVR